MTKAKIEVRQDPTRLRPERRADPARRQLEVHAGDRLGADDPVRADARDMLELLARALTRARAGPSGAAAPAARERPRHRRERLRRPAPGARGPVAPARDVVGARPRAGAARGARRRRRARALRALGHGRRGAGDRACAARARPDAVVHLAGQSQRRRARSRTRRATFAANALGTCAPARGRARRRSRGAAPGRERRGLRAASRRACRATEEHAVPPVSPYGAEQGRGRRAVGGDAQGYGMRVVIRALLQPHRARAGAARSRSPRGRARSPHRGEAARGEAGPFRLAVGNLTPVRDLSDVRDVVRAYLVLLGQGRRSGAAYNVCRGKGVAARGMRSRRSWRRPHVTGRRWSRGSRAARGPADLDVPGGAIRGDGCRTRSGYAAAADGDVEEIASAGRA